MKKKRVQLGKPLPPAGDESIPTDNDLRELSSLWDAYAPKGAAGLIDAVLEVDAPEGWRGWVFDGTDYIKGNRRVTPRQARDYLRSFVENYAGVR